MKVIFKTHHLLIIFYILLSFVLLRLFVSVLPVWWKYYIMVSYVATLPNYFQWHQTGCLKIGHSEYLYHGSQLKLKIHKWHKIINTGGVAGMTLHELGLLFCWLSRLKKEIMEKVFTMHIKIYQVFIYYIVNCTNI